MKSTKSFYKQDKSNEYELRQNIENSPVLFLYKNGLLLGVITMHEIEDRLLKIKEVA